MVWSFNPLAAIGISLAVLFFGYFFGLFEGRSQGYKNRQTEEAEERKHYPVPPASPPPVEGTPVLDFSLDVEGRPRLKMDGKSADTNALSAEQRKRLIEILTQMRPWLEVPKPTPAAPRPVSPQQTSSPTTTMKPTSSPGPSPMVAPVSQGSKQPIPVDDDENDPRAQSQSIVAQINKILQARLAGSPFSSKGIRLQESLDGGVLVWIGLKKFEGVDEVPDETIKAAIKDAIAEWENKYTPS